MFEAVFVVTHMNFLRLAYIVSTGFHGTIVCCWC